MREAQGCFTLKAFMGAPVKGKRGPAPRRPPMDSGSGAGGRLAVLRCGHQQTAGRAVHLPLAAEDEFRVLLVRAAARGDFAQQAVDGPVRRAVLVLEGISCREPAASHLRDVA